MSTGQSAPGADELAQKLELADKGVIVTPGAAAAPPPVDAAELADQAKAKLAIDFAMRWGRVGRAMVPERARAHWTDERLHEVGVELAACAKHYGWDLGGTWNHPLARLGVVTLPLAWPIAEPYARPYLTKLLGLPAGGSTIAASSDGRAEPPAASSQPAMTPIGAEPPPPAPADRPPKVEPIGFVPGA